MATTDTGSFLDSYAQEAAEIQPTEAQLLRAYQNIELAENAESEQAEQQRLLAPRGPSPELKAQLAAADMYAMSLSDPDDITLAQGPGPQLKAGPQPQLLSRPADWKTSEFETFGAEGALLQPEAEPLSKAPVIAPPAFEAPETISPFEGVDMAVEAKSLAREARPLGAVKNYDAMPFKSAFRAALNDGLQTFAWKGKQYTTQTKETLKVAEEKQAEMPPALKVDEERITAIADLPLYEDPSFAIAMEEYGFAPKEGVTTEGIRPEMAHAVKTVAPIFKELGIDASGMVLTSGKRDSGGWSFHETGDAVDLRFRPEQVFPGVTGDELLTKVKEIENKIVEKLGAGWDVDLSRHGTGWHVHIEQETEASRMRLHEHGQQHGIKPKDVKSASSRAQYESFLKSVN